MKIMHLITSLKIGGAEQALANFLHHVKNNQDQHLVVFFYDGPINKKIQAMGFCTHHIRGLIHYADPQALWRLFKLIKKENPDIIHTALWSANIIGRLIAKLCKIPIMCDIHGKSSDEGKLRNKLDRLTVNQATALVAVSQETQQNYYQTIIAPLKNNTLLNQRLSTIPNGIDCATIHANAQKDPLTREALGLTNHDFIVGAVGRLEPIKSYDLLIKALALCSHQPEIKLILVGGGSQEPLLKKLVQTHALEQQVLFAGPQDNAHRFYPLFDCFALSSQSEGLSIALLEALCFGLPIITTHHHTTHDVITHGKHGYLIPPGDIAQYASTIQNLYLNRHNLKQTFATVNQQLVLHQYSIASTAQTYTNLYRRIVNQ